MKTLTVKTQSPYEVVVGEHILDDCGCVIFNATGSKRVLAVTDSGVPKNYIWQVKSSLLREGIEVFEFCFERGERSKNKDTLFEILSFLAENAFTRMDALIAIGGGVVGDITGLAAALYMRGIKFVQVPTTLLAAIDSSVGGKTAIDLKQGKNLAGVFWQPSAVICDVNTFKTLSAEDIRCGLGEGVKYALLCGGKLWKNVNDMEYVERENLLKTHKNGTLVNADMCEFVYECIKIKAEIVVEDERDNGRRAILNLGHSAGHAIETLADYTIPHGVCVAKGIVKILSGLSECRKGLASEVTDIFNRFGIDVSCPFSADMLVSAMRSDKKSAGDYISIVGVYTEGQPFIKRIEFSKLGGML